MASHNLNDRAARKFLDRLKGYEHPQELGGAIVRPEIERPGGNQEDPGALPPATRSSKVDGAAGYGSWVGSLLTLLGSIGILVVLYLSDISTAFVAWNLIACGALILAGATWDLWRGDWWK
jgi:hypothetical protein